MSLKVKVSNNDTTAGTLEEKIVGGTATVTVVNEGGNEYLQIDASGGGGADADAIHDNQANEIHAVTQKATPVGADEILAEDSASSWAKKRMALSDIFANITAALATAANGIKSATTTVDTSAATAPTSGQVLTATGGSAATWQTPSTGSPGVWAVITTSGSEAGLDESPSPELCTKFDTILDGSTSHGVSASAGVVTLPSNTSGFKWEIVAQLLLLHSGTGSCNYQIYSAPGGGNSPIGVAATQIDIASSLRNSWGGMGDAIAWFSGGGTIGVRITFTTSTNTVTVVGGRILVREVKA